MFSQCLGSQDYNIFGKIVSPFPDIAARFLIADTDRKVWTESPEVDTLSELANKLSNTSQ